MPDQVPVLPLFAGARGESDESDEDEDTRLLPAAPDALASRSVAGLLAPPPPIATGALVRPAWPLLLVLARIARGATVRDLASFKQSMVEQVRAFERGALAAGLNPRQVSAARYTLCTAIDEAVSISPWGDKSAWAEASLLSAFHGETWGGEKVFTLIAWALDDAPHQADLLELFYFVLALGFQGKFRVERDGTAAVDALRDRLFSALRARFGSRSSVPTPARAPLGKRTRLIRYVPVWSVGVVCALLSLALLAAFVYQLDQKSTGVVQQIERVAPPSASGDPP